MDKLNSQQLHNLNRDALILLVDTMQDQFALMKEQLEQANTRLADYEKQFKLLTEQIRIMNQRQFGRSSEKAASTIDGQLSLFDSFNEAEKLSEDHPEEPEISLKGLA